MAKRHLIALAIVLACGCTPAPSPPSQPGQPGEPGASLTQVTFENVNMH